MLFSVCRCFFFFYFSAFLFSWLWFFHPWRPSKRQERRKKIKAFDVTFFLDVFWTTAWAFFNKIKSDFIDIFFQLVKCSRYRPGVAQRVGRGIALLFHDRDIRRGWVVSSTPRPHFTSGNDPVPILQEAEWTPGPVWTGGKSRPHRDSIRTVNPIVAIPTELPGPHIFTYLFFFLRT